MFGQFTDDEGLEEWSEPRTVGVGEVVAVLIDEVRSEGGIDEVRNASPLGSVRPARRPAIEEANEVEGLEHVEVRLHEPGARLQLAAEIGDDDLAGRPCGDLVEELPDEFGAPDLGSLLDVGEGGNGAEVRLAPGRAESSCRSAEHHFGETTLGDQLGVVVAAEVRGWRSRKPGGEQAVNEGLADAHSLAH